MRDNQDKRAVTIIKNSTILEYSLSKKIIAKPREKNWKKVLNLPKKLTFALFSFSVCIKYWRILPIESSLHKIKIVIDRKIKLSKWKEIKTNKLQTKILSAKRSKFDPRIDSWFKNLAT